jgi:hypothetical protein
VAALNASLATYQAEMHRITKLAPSRRLGTDSTGFAHVRDVEAAGGGVGDEVGGASAEADHASSTM